MVDGHVEQLRGGFQNTSKVYVYDGANFNDCTFTDMYNEMVTDNLRAGVQHELELHRDLRLLRRRR